MAKQFLQGYEGVLYFGDAVLTARPPDAGTTFLNSTWNEYDNAMDVDGNFESEKVDTTTRAEAKVGWASEIATTKRGELAFTARWKPGDTLFDKLMNAWLGGSSVAVLDLDEAVSVEGAQGLTANMSVSFGQKKPVKGIQTIDVSLTVASFPNWVKVVTGALEAVVPT